MFYLKWGRTCVCLLDFSQIEYCMFCRSVQRSFKRHCSAGSCLLFSCQDWFVLVNFLIVNSVSYQCTKCAKAPFQHLKNLTNLDYYWWYLKSVSRFLRLFSLQNSVEYSTANNLHVFNKITDFSLSIRLFLFPIFQDLI